MESRLCANPECQKPLEGKRSNALHCNNACRTRAYKIRKGLTPEAMKHALEEAHLAVDRLSSITKKKG